MLFHMKKSEANAEIQRTTVSMSMLQKKINPLRPMHNYLTLQLQTKQTCIVHKKCMEKVSYDKGISLNYE